VRGEGGFGAPVPLFETEAFFVGAGLGLRAQYDVHPGGQRFLVLRPAGDAAASEIHVVLNWFEELKRLVPTD